MYYVYLIRSINFPDIVYVGYTTNIEQRLDTHNGGGSIYTAQYGPWQLVMYLCFSEQEKAISFEKYIKIGSGQSFAKKRFW
jgi:putative endonuclease